jgi:thiol-disulfide isomerase/thioredoxin
VNQAFWHILVLLLVVVVAILTFVQIGTMRQVGALLVQLRPGRIGDVEGGPEIDSVVDVPGLPVGRPAIVLFVSASCSLCDMLKPSIPVVVAHYPDVEMISVVVGDDLAKRLEYAKTIPGARADLAQLGEHWDVQGTPFVVGIDHDHRVRSTGAVNTLDQLENLAEAVLLARQEIQFEEQTSADDHRSQDVEAEVAIGAGTATTSA